MLDPWYRYAALYELRLKAGAKVHPPKRADVKKRQRLVRLVRDLLKRPVSLKSEYLDQMQRAIAAIEALAIPVSTRESKQLAEKRDERFEQLSTEALA